MSLNLRIEFYCEYFLLLPFSLSVIGQTLETTLLRLYYFIVNINFY